MKLAEEGGGVNGNVEWFFRTGLGSAPARLFWFPHSGGNAAVIGAWQAHLAAAELYVAQLPARGLRLTEEPVTDLDNLVAPLAAAVADLADRPFAFLGHSVGALIAFEVARALRRQGSPSPRWLWACGAEGPACRVVTRRVAELPDAELIGVLRDYGGTSAEILASADLMEMLLPGVRADFAINEGYAYRPEPPLDVPIRVLRGDRDPIIDPARTVGWARETTRPLPERVFAGDHFFLTGNEAEIAGLVAADFSSERPNPYRSLPGRSFWRTAVAEPDPGEIGDLWQPKFTVGPDDPILTVGSCFSRRIGRALLEAGMNWYDAEPPPPGLSAADRAARHYGEFSFRTGNVYTAASLRQWLAWASGAAVPPDATWEEGGRHFDPYRPAVDPDGYPSAAAAVAARDVTLNAIRAGLSRAACLLFTLGLTEAWHDRLDGTVYPACPGTIRGVFDEHRHELRNAGFADVHEDLTAAVALARAINPDLRVLLTVSPVPLTATATGGHALVANTHTKSLLRAAAGQLAAELDGVDYFPSYELIIGSPFAARFYEPNLRTVSAEGIALVMRHFLAAFGPRAARQPAVPAVRTGGDPDCDDAVLDYYRTS